MARSRDKGKPVQIIDAAFSAFGDIGYEATLMRDIADRAGISSGTIYTYFRDKKDLFRATVEEGWNRFLAESRALAESPAAPGDRLQRFIDIGFGTLKRFLPLLRGMLFESSQEKLLQGKLDEYCALADELVPGRARHRPRTRQDRERRRTLIRMIVVGVLFSAALADPATVDAEIDSLKRTITFMLSGG